MVGNNNNNRIMVRNNRNSKGRLPSQELLDDLCSRFLLNVPNEDLETFERILFLLEQAHWFYEDNSVEQDTTLRSLSFKEFTSLMFHNCAHLRPYIRYLDAIHRHFTEYKSSVPVSGAIILDETLERVLLVKGWKANACWSFPRGKRSKDEEDAHVAIREVEEETGFDLREILNEEDNFETIVGDQKLKLYIVPGIKSDFPFAPRTKKEISEIAWHRLDELEPISESVVTRSVIGLKLYMVAPFLQPIKTWMDRPPMSIVKKSNPPVKGFTVWKAKHNSNDGTTGTTGTAVVPVPEPKPVDNRPGMSFRNFKFDIARIMQALDFAVC